MMSDWWPLGRREDLAERGVLYDELARAVEQAHHGICLLGCDPETPDVDFLYEARARQRRPKPRSARRGHHAETASREEGDAHASCRAAR